MRFQVRGNGDVVLTVGAVRRGFDVDPAAGQAYLCCNECDPSSGDCANVMSVSKRNASTVAMIHQVRLVQMQEILKFMFCIFNRMTSTVGSTR